MYFYPMNREVQLTTGIEQTTKTEHTKKKEIHQNVCWLTVKSERKMASMQPLFNALRSLKMTIMNHTCILH